MERLNRSELGALSAESLNGIIDFDEEKKRTGKPVIGSYDFVPPISVLYDAQRPTVLNQTVMYLTNKTMKRVRNMNISAFLGPDNDAVKMVFTKDECAYLVFHAEGRSMGTCSAAYCVKDGKIYMKVFSGEYIAGYIIPDRTDGNKICLLPYSIFSLSTYTDRAVSKELWPKVSYLSDLVMKDFPDGRFPTDVSRLTKRKNYEKMKCHDLIEDHMMFQNILCDALQALIFLKTSEVYSKEFVPDSTPTFRRKKGFRPLGYIQVDTTWDMDIDVNTPFPVRGHFVHQPCKVGGEWTRKIIYVEQYMKKGYHRKAKKTQINF